MFKCVTTTSFNKSGYFVHSFFNDVTLILSADPPKIKEHPNDQSVATGADIAFAVEATGDDLHFQWQKNRCDLDDGDRCCGTCTNRLRIIEVEKGDKGRYRCLVKNSVGYEFSHEAFLIVSKFIMCSSTLDNILRMYGADVAMTCTSTSLVVSFCRNPYCNLWCFSANWSVA